MLFIPRTVSPPPLDLGGEMVYVGKDTQTYSQLKKLNLTLSYNINYYIKSTI